MRGCLLAKVLYFVSVSFFVALSLSLHCCARDPFPFSPSSLPLSTSGKCFPSLFAFGDSKTDTGNRQAYFPFESRSEGPPYGRTFFGCPSDRFCDGRLIIDFQAQAYGLPLLSPYARGVGSDFRHGVNFAVSGSACIPNVADSVFYLTRQLNQFKKLKALYIYNYATDNSYLPPREYIGGGLYVINTGENDYRAGINNMGLSPEEVKEQLVPKVVEITYSTIKELYKEGARKFLVVGTAADGCISMMLTRVPHEEPEDLDPLGCLTSVNNYVQYHNELLFKAVKSLRVELSDAHIAYGDFFSSNVNILVNASNYGFEVTHKACCGIGGNYNYNPLVQCGQTGEVEGNNVTAYSCEDPSKYINWDGIHLTEHFYELIALDFLHGRFMDQPSMLPPSCVLNFSSFSTYSKFGKSFSAFKPF